jgi:hypothetical protein
MTSARALIQFCTFIAVALGLLACGFIQKGYYAAAVIFLILMAVYVALLRRMWGRS